MLVFDQLKLPCERLDQYRRNRTPLGPDRSEVLHDLLCERQVLPQVLERAADLRRVLVQ